MKKIKLNREMPFVRITDGSIYITYVGNSPGDGYGYLSIVDEGMMMIHEFMSQDECGNSLAQEGYIDFQDAVQKGLIPSGFKLPTSDESPVVIAI